jgi:phospholipase/lecithinase/hemolysin
MTSGSVSAAAAPPAFSGVFVFGDSLSDPGNDLKAAQLVASLPFLSIPGGAPTADKGYFQGRFSDGYNAADLVSNKLLHEPTAPTFPYGVTSLFGVPIPFAPRPTGNNLSFAYGGATAIGSEPPPSLHSQINIYKAFPVDPNALYVVEIGSNDVLSMVGTSGAPVVGAAANAQLDAIATEIAQEVAQLYARGARHVLVANIPDLGVLPAYTGAQDEALRRSLLTQYAQSVDALLKADLGSFSLPAGATLYQYDLQAYTDAVVANPAAFDFTNVTQALRTVQPVAPDPAGGGFLFFDGEHPTAQAHAQIASQVLAALQGATPNWTAAPGIGSQAASAIPAGGHADFTASLAAGQSYVFDVEGVSSGAGTLADPFLRVLNGSGAVVAQADDGGIGLDSHLQFVAPATGDYTVEISGVGVTSGGFRVQAGAAAGGNLLLSGALRGSNESVLGGVTNDTITALAGTNDLRGFDGDDSITGGSAFDSINGNKGADTIVGRSLSGDILLGGQGNDLITTVQSTGHNAVNGNRGDDTVVGGPGGDTLRGGQGDDVISGGSGADWISGDLGRNTLTGGGAADIFHAGPGQDLVTDFNVAQGDRVQIDAGTSYVATQSGSDTLISLSDGGQMTLAGVQMTNLAAGWIFAA